MQHQTPESHAEIASFVTEGIYRIAIISTNEYGFQLSTQMAQTYLQRALILLESKQSFDRASINEVSTLKILAGRLVEEYAQLEKFCTDCDRFNNLQTKDIVEWFSKWVVRAISRGHLLTTSHHLAYKIRAFHSSACSVLVENNRFLSPNG